MEKKESPRVTGISDITGKVVRVRHATDADMVFIEKQMKEHNFYTDDLNYNEFVVATEDNRITGFGRMKQRCNICAIGCVVVVEEKKGQGTGAVIIRHLIDYAPVNKVYVMTDRLDYFKGLGFAEAKEGAQEYFDALGLAAFECQPEGKKKAVLMAYEKADSV